MFYDYSALLIHHNKVSTFLFFTPIAIYSEVTEKNQNEVFGVSHVNE